jgi:hypothetical protein
MLAEKDKHRCCSFAKENSENVLMSLFRAFSSQTLLQAYSGITRTIISTSKTTTATTTTTTNPNTTKGMLINP